MNEKIQCVLCSYGLSGRVFHAPLIEAHPRLNLLGVLERNHQLSKQSYPQVQIFPDLEHLLKETSSKLVIVNVPDHLHFEFSLAALRAGKHVVVEKPITISSWEAEKLIKLADSSGLHLFTFQNRRWDSDFLTVQDLLKKGDLGRIIEFEAHFDRYRPIPPTDTWKEDPKKGTGLLYNLGSHLIDQALVLFGTPQEVFADMSIMRTQGKINDYFHLILFYPRHRVILHSSYLVKEPACKYLIHGEKGTFIKNGQDPQEARLSKEWKANHPDIGKEDPADWGTLYTAAHPEGIVIPSKSGNYSDFYDGVVQTLNGEPENAVTGRAGLNVLRVIEAALHSQETGQKVKIQSDDQSN